MAGDDGVATHERLCGVEEVHAAAAAAGDAGLAAEQLGHDAVGFEAAGEGVAMLIDQHMHGPDAIWVNFFERPAATTSTLAAIALRTGAVVVPVFALPLPGGRFRFVYESPVEPPSGDGPDAVHEFTQRCTDVLEMHVRRRPELWLWMHRRWRDAPTPETSGMFPKVKDVR